MGFGDSSSSNATTSIQGVVNHLSTQGLAAVRAYFAAGNKDRPLFDAVLDGKINGDTVAAIYAKSNLPIAYRQFNPLMGFDRTQEVIQKLLSQQKYALLCEFIAKIDNPNLLDVFTANAGALVAQVTSVSSAKDVKIQQSLISVIYSKLGYELLTKLDNIPDSFDGLWRQFDSSLRPFQRVTQNHLYIRGISSGFYIERRDVDTSVLSIPLPYTRAILAGIFSANRISSNQKSLISGVISAQDRDAVQVAFLTNFVSKEHPSILFKLDDKFFDGFNLSAAIAQNQSVMNLYSALMELEYFQAVITMLTPLSIPQRWQVLCAITPSAWAVLDAFPEEGKKFFTRLLPLLTPSAEVTDKDIFHIFTMAYASLGTTDPSLLGFVDMHCQTLLVVEGFSNYIKMIIDEAREQLGKNFKAWENVYHFDKIRKLIANSYAHQYPLVLFALHLKSVITILHEMDPETQIQTFGKYTKVCANCPIETLLLFYTSIPALGNEIREFIASRQTVFVDLLNLNTVDALRMVSQMTVDQKQKLWQVSVIQTLVERCAGMSPNVRVTPIQDAEFVGDLNITKQIWWWNQSSYYETPKWKQGTASEYYHAVRSQNLIILSQQAAQMLESFIQVAGNRLNLDWPENGKFTPYSVFIGLPEYSTKELNQKILAQLSKNALEKLIGWATATGIPNIDRIFQSCLQKWPKEYDLMSYVTAIENELLPPPFYDAPSAPIAIIPPKTMQDQETQTDPLADSPLKQKEPAGTTQMLAMLSAQVQALTVLVQSLQSPNKLEDGSAATIHRLEDEITQLKQAATKQTLLYHQQMEALSGELSQTKKQLNTEKNLHRFEQEYPIAGAPSTQLTRKNSWSK